MEGAEHGLDTALLVAMVPPQSELHRSFAAQLANYPQAATLIRRRMFFVFLLNAALRPEYK